MKTSIIKTTSSELQRCAEEALRNEQRLAQWRARYTLATGHEPVRCANPVLSTTHCAALAKDRNDSTQSNNANRIKRPKYRRQYMHSNLSEFETG